MSKQSKILIIEDNDEMRENISEILALAGYEVFVAKDGILGIQEARTQLPHLILCDIMMPNLDGFGVLKIKSQDPLLKDIPLIFLTAKAEKEDFRKGMNLGAEDYLMKPFDDVDLLQIIETKLEKYERLSTNYKVKRLASLVRFNEFKNLPQVKELVADSAIKDFGKKSILWNHDEPISNYMWLENGIVKESLDTVGFKEIIIDFVHDRNFIDNSYLFKSHYRSKCETVEACKIKFISKQQLESIIVQENMMQALLEHSLSQYHDISRRLAVNSFGNVREKIAYHLLILHQTFKEQVIRLSREDLSSFCGMAKETLIRTLADFKEEKLIDTDAKSIIILNMKGLENIID
ncbi:MAG: response regulator [Saprospiraceae bacterium]|nr:response regulator [Saprospiraceae bacterium]MBK9631141.1 response regulator [Saprospiraceae bacterium]